MIEHLRAIRSSSARWAAQATAATTFCPPIHEDGVPHLHMGGLLVFVWIDQQADAVVVHVDSDGGSSPLANPDGTVSVITEGDVRTA